MAYGQRRRAARGAWPTTPQFSSSSEPSQAAPSIGSPFVARGAFAYRTLMWRHAGVGAGLWALIACSSPEEPEATQGLPSRFIVTADYLEGTLSILDYDRTIAGGEDVELPQVRLRTIDLRAFTPGPLQLELTPDGGAALVAIGPGFYDALGALYGFPDIEGEGGLAIVTLETGEVQFVSPRHTPMGVAVSADGARGFSANFGRRGAPGDSLTELDLVSGAILSETQVGSRPEQVRLLGDQLGAVNLAGEGGVRLFHPAAPGESLGPLIPTGADPSDIALLDASTAVVAESRAPMGYTVLDVSGVNATIREQRATQGKLPYGIAHIPGTREVLLSIATGAPAELIRVDLQDEPSVVHEPTQLENEQGSFILQVTVSPDGQYALVPIPIDNSLAVVHLASGTTHHVRGWTNAAPSYAKVHWRAD